MAKASFLEKLIPNAHDTKQQRTNKIALLAAAGVVVIGIVVGAVFLIKSLGAKDPIDVEPSSEIVSSEEETSSIDETIFDPGEITYDEATGIINDPDFLSLYAENPQFVGRLSIPGTKLDYPVVQGIDNAYYLDRDFHCNHEPYGIPFLDYRAWLGRALDADGNYSLEESRFFTIYGHSKDDGTYMQAVKEYVDFDFYKEHPNLTFNTINGPGEYKVIAYMLVDTNINKPDVFNFWDYLNDVSEEKFNHYMEEVNKRTYYNTGIDVKYGDQFVVLSTCNTEVDASNSTPYRSVLVARRVRVGESTTVDVDKVEINKDVVMPEGWIKKYGKKTPFEE